MNLKYLLAVIEQYFLNENGNQVLAYYRVKQFTNKLASMPMGTAFFFVLNGLDKNRIRGLSVDPFGKDDSESIIAAIKFLSKPRTKVRS